MIGGVDLAPTLLAAAGLTPPAAMEGLSFLPLLDGREQEGRERVFTAFYVTALAEQVPTRAVQERRYGYIFNRWADGATQCQDEAHKGLALQAMIQAARTDPAAAQRVVHFLFRATEELYDFAADPDGLDNLASQPGHKAELERLRGELRTWMHRTGDPLLVDFDAHLSGRLTPMSSPKDPSQRGS
jgi:N-sulfoglucosamine sulfohydrolase